MRWIHAAVLMVLSGMAGTAAADASVAQCFAEQPVAAVEQPVGPQEQAAAETASRFTGQPVSLDFQRADLRAVLRTFSAISGLNVVIDPGVEGVVDVALQDVPWDQALDVILRANRLGYSVDGSIVRIAPLSVLAEEEAERRKLAEQRALAGELQVLTRTLSYARAPELAAIVAPLLSVRGQVQTDVRTNTMVITDLQDRVAAAGRLLDELDRREPQVEIEAHIVQAGQDFARSIGVQWNLGGGGGLDGSGAGPARQPEGEESGGQRGAGGSVDLRAANQTSALGLTFGSVAGGMDLNVVLSAAEVEGRVRLLSHPRVTTQNNVQAEIVQGDQIPIQVVANNTVTVRFEDAALVMRVEPRITAAGTVIMELEIENDFADFGRAVGGIPPIVTQRARTTVQVASGETTVIGGIFEHERSTSRSRVPVLHRIPLLGWLFGSRAERDSTDELLIFLTPRIVP